MRKITFALIFLISFLLLTSIASAQFTPLDIISNFLNSILNLFIPTASQEKTIPSSGSIVYPPPSGNPFGVFVWKDVNNDELNLAKDLGVKWITIGQSGEFSYRGDPNWWSQIESLTNRIRQKDMEVIFRFGSYDATDITSDVDGFVQFCVDMIVANNVPVAVIIDEPHTEFKEGTPQEYVNIFKKVYPAIKAVKPDTIVVCSFGYSAMNQVYPDSDGDTEFSLDALYQLGLLKYCDALSVHGFVANRPEGPEYLLTSHKMLRDYLEGLEDGKFADMPLYVSGWGFTLTEADSGGTHTVEEHAACTRRTAEILSGFPDVKALCYFYLEMSSGNWSAAGGTLLSSTSSPYNPTPSYYAYQDFISTYVD